MTQRGNDVGSFDIDETRHLRRKEAARLLAPAGAVSMPYVTQRAIRVPVIVLAEIER